MNPEEINPILEANNSATVKQSGKMFKIFARPNMTMEDMRKVETVENYIQEHQFDHEVLEQTEIQVKYSGYIEKEKNNADKLHRLENLKIPSDFDYMKLAPVACALCYAWG